MFSPRLLLLVALAVAWEAASSAQTATDKPEDLTDQIITGAWADPAKCNSGNATRVTFKDAVRGTDVARGECVSITAYWAGRALFESKTDANAPKSSVTSRLSGRRVGIYADERTFISAPRKPKLFTIIGTYASCLTEWRGAMMVLGYCHFSDGPFLKVSQTMPPTGGMPANKRSRARAD